MLIPWWRERSTIKSIVKVYPVYGNHKDDISVSSCESTFVMAASEVLAMSLLVSKGHYFYALAFENSLKTYNKFTKCESLQYPLITFPFGCKIFSVLFADSLQSSAMLVRSIEGSKGRVL